VLKQFDVSALLQISEFTDNTTPSRGEVGAIIKRVEDKIDDKVGHPFRPIIYRDEVHNFEFFKHSLYPVQPFKDYVGFIQLERPKIMKIVRLEVWQNDKYVDLASATAKIKVPSSTTESNWNITLTAGPHSFTLTENTHFYDSFGPKTTASQIVDAINEVFPAKTARFTGETAAKSVTATGNTSINVSDFFYATTDSEAGDTVVISSLLLGDDGSACTVNSTFGTVTNFTDHQDQRRLGDYWTINSESKIFFLRQYPFLQNHSIRVTYVSGDSRVPAPIHEAATKLVAAEVIRHDDNSIMIAETGSNIDLKAKHDILKEEAMEIINGKKEMIHFIS